MISKLGSKFIEYDPGYAMLGASLRVALSMFIATLISKYILKDESIITTWIFIYIFYASTSTLFGNIMLRKRILTYYTISFLAAVFIASQIKLNGYELLGAITVVFLSFLAFNIRRFGELFMIFPPFIILIFSIVLIQMPIQPELFFQLIVSTFISSIVFYIIVLRLSSWNTPMGLKILVEKFTKEFYINSRRYHTAQANQENSTFYLSPKLSIIKLHDGAGKYYSMGNKWIIDSSRKELWERIWAYNSMATTQVLLLREGMIKVSKFETSMLDQHVKRLDDVIIMLFSLLRTIVYNQKNQSIIDMQYNAILSSLDEISLDILDTKRLHVDVDELKIYVDLWFNLRRLTYLIYKVDESVKVLK